MNEPTITFFQLLPPNCSEEYREQMENSLYSQAMLYLTEHLADSRCYRVQVMPYAETAIQMQGLQWTRLVLVVHCEELNNASCE